MDQTLMQHSRRIYSILALFGDFGGLKDCILFFFGLLLAPYQEHFFLLKAIKKLYFVVTRFALFEE